MKSTSWKDIAELVGLSAIVAWLIFVGMQMKQSHEIALATQYQARTEASLNLFTAILESGYVAPPLRDKVSEDFTAEDIAVNTWLWVAFDNHNFQYQNGFLTEEAWQGQVRSMKAVYDACFARFVYEERKHMFRAELIALVESWEDKC